MRSGRGERATPAVDPAQVTGEVVRSVLFRQHRRGYHPDDVDEFLETVAWALDAQRRRIAELEETLAGGGRGAEPADGSVPSSGLEDRLDADQHGEVESAGGRAAGESAAEEQARLERQLAVLERRLTAERARLRRVLDEIGGMLGGLSVMDPFPPARPSAPHEPPPPQPGGTADA